MKISIIVHYFDPHVGGMEQVAKKQAQSLVAAHHHTTVVTCRPGRNVPLDEKKDGYRIVRLRALNFIENKFGVTFPLISPLAFFRIFRQVRSADVVHIHDVFYMSSHMAMMAAMLCKKPVYLTQHVAMVEHPSTLVMAVQRLVYGTFGKLIFSRAKNIICYNTNVRDFLLDHGVAKGKILLHYNGIDIDFFVPATSSEKRALRKKYGLETAKPVVLFVGRLVPKKGFDIVFDARSDAYQTLIVGTGEVPAHMRQAAHVRFFGGATPGQLRELYQLSDVFVFPAVGEILTLVMQEAMACGLPVVTTNDPAYERYGIDPDGMQRVSRDVQGVSGGIQAVLADAAIARRMSSYSRQLAIERFSWEVNFGEELALYPERGHI